MVFVVSADAAVRDSVKNLVESASLVAETFPSLQAFLDTVDSPQAGCLVFDAQISDRRDRQQQARLTAACAHVPTILIADRGDVPMAVCALRSGAVDVVQKPYGEENLLDSIRRALEPGAAARG